MNSKYEYIHVPRIRHLAKASLKEIWISGDNKLYFESDSGFVLSLSKKETLILLKKLMVHFFT